MLQVIYALFLPPPNLLCDLFLLLSNLQLILSSVFVISGIVLLSLEVPYLHFFSYRVHLSFYLLEHMEYIYNSCFNTLSAYSNICMINFLLAEDDIVLFFVGLKIFYWRPDILNFMLLSVTFCCFLLIVVGLCLEV